MVEWMDGLSNRLHASGERALATLLAYVAVAVLVALAAGAGLYAAATAISQSYGPIVAALSIAGISLLSAVIILVWLSVRSRRLQRRIRLQKLTQPGVASLAATALPGMLKASPIGTLAAVAAAVYVLQRANQQRPDRR